MPDVPKIDIRPDQWEIVRGILHKHVPQYAVWAFGSRAKWLAKQYSDLDLAIITDQPLSLSVSAALADDFSESDLPWKVDVVDWATTSESFRKIIERDKVVVQKPACESLDMVGEWRETTLDQLGRIVTGKTPPSTVIDAFGGHVPFVTPSDMDGSRIISTTARNLSASGHTAVKNSGIPKNAVMVSCIGSDMGKAAIAGTDCVTNQQINSIIIDTDDSPLFVYYNLSTRKAEIRGAASGSAQPILNKSAFGRLEIELPPSSEQHAIVHILGTLDDKIELNRRRNETLEAMARALFKSWFVDFDGVAKSELVESELGLIPKGWEVKRLGDMTSYLNRGLSPKYVEAGGVLVLNQKCVRDGRVDGLKGRRHDPAQRSIEGRLLEVGDVLVNSTGVGTLGRIAQILSVNEPTIVDSHVTIVRADPASISWNYLGIALREREAEIEALGEGSTGQTELSRVRLSMFSILVPPKALRECFDDAVLALRMKSQHNDEQNAILTTLRDSLLPKLLSGELRVQDTEKLVGGTA